MYAAQEIKEQKETWKSTNATGAPYVLCIFSFKNPGYLIEKIYIKHNQIQLLQISQIKNTLHAHMSTDLENTWISSCSLQDGPRLATNKVAHGVEF